MAGTGLGSWRMLLASVLLAGAAVSCNDESDPPGGDGPTPVDSGDEVGDATIDNDVPLDDAVDPEDTSTPDALDGGIPDLWDEGPPPLPTDTTPDPGEDAGAPDVAPDPDTIEIDADPPECDEGATREQTCPDGSVAQSCRCDAGLWVCAGDGCRDASCDDGSTLTCRMMIPICEPGLIVAVIDSCYQCVSPRTCEAPVVGPPLPGRCSEDADCADSQVCRRAGPTPFSSCVNHDCETEREASCRMLRPTCGEREISVVRDGCWVCVNERTCEAPASTGPTRCRGDAACAAGEYCDACGSSSCPECDDCIATCAPHLCDSESTLTCRCAQPECGEDGVAVIREGCWVCVDVRTCRAQTDRDACL